MNVIRVAPDPGVIEVNIHPSSSWRECVATTEAIYEEARLARLGADKFMIDGKHSGTGGGNHVVVGGATPLDSPFLRRPDLLKSLVIHWLRHPSLSYFFSGLFIGPTSQAPRIDEARHDSLYELEIALAQIPPPGKGQPRAVAARSPDAQSPHRRHRQHPSGGNLHRQALFARRPDRPSRPHRVPRLRDAARPAHEPRPAIAHPGNFSRLWRDPLGGALPRWGPSLHDRFMLPHFVWEDLLDVLADLKAHGFPFRSDWYEAQAEFRFPFCGEVESRASSSNCARRWSPGMCWARTGAIGGTARYTDSSTERLQVKLTGPGSGTLPRRLQPAPRAPGGTRDKGRRGRRGAL